MFSPATVASFAPLILGITQASAVQQVHRADVSPVPAKNLSPAALIVLGGDANEQCHDYNDWDCYRKSYDKNYGQCWDRCYHDHENCDKYKECHGEGDECYRKKRRDDYCDPHDDDAKKCRDKHEDPKDFCRPHDWDCHKRKDHDHDYKCCPEKDKDCYPDYPDYPDYGDGDDNGKPPNPTNNVIVKFFGPECEYQMDIWPNGEEHYTEKNDKLVKQIKYWTHKDEHNVRCLPMKNWFPWTPLRIHEYKEQRRQEGDWKVRIIELKKPEPVEVIRCDYP